MDSMEQENQRMEALKALIDDTSRMLSREVLTLAEARPLIDAAKQKVLDLFPDGERLFELIYRPRFEKIVRGDLLV